MPHLRLAVVAWGTTCLALSLLVVRDVPSAVFCAILAVVVPLGFAKSIQSSLQRQHR